MFTGKHAGLSTPSVKVNMGYFVQSTGNHLLSTCSYPRKDRNMDRHENRTIVNNIFYLFLLQWDWTGFIFKRNNVLTPNSYLYQKTPGGSRGRILLVHGTCAAIFGIEDPWSYPLPGRELWTALRLLRFPWFRIFSQTNQFFHRLLPIVWVNYNTSLTWIVRLFGDDSPYSFNNTGLFFNYHTFAA